MPSERFLMLVGIVLVAVMIGTLTLGAYFLTGYSRDPASVFEKDCRKGCEGLVYRVDFKTRVCYCAPEVKYTPPEK